MIDLATHAAEQLSPTDVAILDATRACVVDFGVRRTTLTEVARRAGVSRPTVYRRWPDTGSLIAELLVRGRPLGILWSVVFGSRLHRPEQDACKQQRDPSHDPSLPPMRHARDHA